MPFSTNYKESAYRHFDDASKLHETNRLANAGYHYGFASECAFKYALVQASVTQSNMPRAGNPIWKHFGSGTGSGTLKQTVVLLSSGRLAANLVKVIALANQPAFMGGWETAMRYAPSAEVGAADCVRWQHDALTAIVDLL